MLQDRIFPATLMPDADWWHNLWSGPDGVARALGIGPGMTIVDLGCGDGYFTAALARQAAPGRVVALDIGLGEPRGPATAVRLSPEQTLLSVAPAGFELAKLVEFPPYHYGAIFSRSVIRRTLPLP
jgi:SAM-dependent methyltransferase